SGKVAFITGSAQGIGLGIAKELAAQGATVMLSDKNEKKLAEVVASLKQQKVNVEGIYCDVTKKEDIKNAIQQTKEKFGQLHIVMNNAGMQHVSILEDFPSETFERMIKIMQI